MVEDYKEPVWYHWGQQRMDTFIKQFQKKFIPKQYKEEKIVEIEQLVQGVLSIQENEI